MKTMTSKNVKRRLRNIKDVNPYCLAYVNLLADRLDRDLTADDFVGSSIGLIRELKAGENDDPLSYIFDNAEDEVYTSLTTMLPNLARQVLPFEMIDEAVRGFDKAGTLALLQCEGIDADISEAELCTLNAAINGWYLDALAS
jgi:hypothetical protein